MAVNKCTRMDCIYHASEREEHGCNYLLVTGKSRIAQHSVDERSPEHCRLYTAGKRKLIPTEELALEGALLRKAAIRSAANS